VAIAFENSFLGLVGTALNATVVASDAQLIVGIFDTNVSGANPISAMSWDGSGVNEQLIKIDEVKVVGDVWLSLWSYFHPTPKSALIAIAGGGTYLMIATVLSGVPSPGVDVHGAATNASSTTSTVGSLNVGAGAWEVSIARENAGVTATWTNATERQAGGGLHMADSGSVLSNGAVTVTATYGAAHAVGIVTASFGPPFSGGGGSNWGPMLGQQLNQIVQPNI
jgi:hypothetical protein